MDKVEIYENFETFEFKYIYHYASGSLYKESMTHYNRFNEIEKDVYFNFECIECGAEYMLDLRIVNNHSLKELIIMDKCGLLMCCSCYDDINNKF